MSLSESETERRWMSFQQEREQTRREEEETERRRLERRAAWKEKQRKWVAELPPVTMPLPLPFISARTTDGHGNPKWDEQWERSLNHLARYIDELHQLVIDLQEQVDELSREA